MNTVSDQGNETWTQDVAVIGLGYIGLPTAAALATRGANVVGVDVNPSTVAAVNRGEVPFVEPDLAVAVSGAVSMGRLQASSEVPVARSYIIAVPTPFQDGHQADLSYIRAAVESIAPQLRPGALVILESTSPPGTTRTMARWMAEMRPDLRFPGAESTGQSTGQRAGESAGEQDGIPDVAVAHCPERVLPGRIMIEIVANNRVIGGMTPGCAERAAELYRVFAQGELRLTDAESAEMTKLTENAFRDVNIAFANELSLICDRLGINTWEVLDLANLHPRVNILRPGPGVGGHCIAVDPWFIVSAAPDEARLMRTAREVNDGKPDHVVGQVTDALHRVAGDRTVDGLTVACFGLAFKADVDDLRESPAVEVVTRLAKAYPTLDLLAVEPHVPELPLELQSYDNLRLVELDEALSSADVVVLLVDHHLFHSVDRGVLAGKQVIDTRGLWRDLSLTQP